MAGINLQFIANTTAAQAQINALERTMEGLDNKMAQVFSKPIDMASWREAGTILSSLGSTQIDLGSPVRQMELLTDKINKGKISYDEYKRAVSGSTNVVTQQLALQGASIDNIISKNGKLSGTFNYGDVMASQMSGATTAIQRTGMEMRVQGQALSAYNQGLVDMGKNMAFSARQLTISLSAPIAIGGGLSMKAFSDMEGDLTDIAKVYDDTKDDFVNGFDEIKEQARGVSKTLSDELSMKNVDSMSVQKFYAQQGLTGKNLEESTRQAGRLSLLGDVDMETAQQAITTLTNVYGINAQEMAKYVDYMNKFEDSTTLTMQDYADALPKIGGIVTQFMKEPQEAMQVTSELMEAGKRGGITSATEIANSVKSIFSKVARPTKQLQTVFAELSEKNGKQLDIVDINTKHSGNLLEVLKEISFETKDWSNTDKSKLFAQLAGAEQLSRMTILMQQLEKGNEAVGEVNAQLREQPGLLAENSKKQEQLINDTPEKKVTRLLNRLQNVGYTIGKEIFGPVMAVAGGIASMLETVVNLFSKLPDSMQGILGALTLMTAATGPLIGVLGAGIQLAGTVGKGYGRAKSVVGTKLYESSLPGGQKLGKKLGTKEDFIAKYAADAGNAFEMSQIRDREFEAISRASNASAELASSFVRLNANVNQASGRMASASTTMKNASTNTQSAIDRAAAREMNTTKRMDPARTEAKRQALLNPLKRETVAMPVRPKAPTNYELSQPNTMARHQYRMAQYEENVRKAKERQIKLDLEQTRQEQQRQRIESRYISYANYLEKTPDDVRMQQTEAMRKKWSQDETSALAERLKRSEENRVNNANKSVVQNGLRAVNSDLAHSVNVGKSEAQVTALRARQAQLISIINGGQKGIAAEAERLRKSAEDTNKSVGGMRTAFRNILPTVATIRGDMTDVDKLTKAENFQMSGREASALNKAAKKDPVAFQNKLAMYKPTAENPIVDTNIPIGRKGQTMQMDEARYNAANQIAQRHIDINKGLEQSQERINKKVEVYADKLSASLAVGGMLGSMFGGDNKIVQGFSAAASTIGMVGMMIPSVMEKAVGKVSGAWAKFTSMAAAAGAGAGNSFGGSFADRAKARMGGVASFIGKNIGAIAGWGAAIVGVGLAMKSLYDMAQKGAKENAAAFKESTESAKRYAEVLGYTYKGPSTQPQRDLEGVTEEQNKAAEAMKNDEYLKKNVVDKIKGLSVTNGGTDIEQLRMILRPEAVKILGSGGTDADVKEMVKSALIAAGADQATIDDFQLNLDVKNPEMLMPENTVQDWKDMASGGKGHKSGWAGFFAGSESATVKEGTNVNSAYDSTAWDVATGIYTSYSEAMNAAGPEARKHIADELIATVRGAQDDAEKNKGTIKGERSRQIAEDTTRQIAEDSGVLNNDFGKEALSKSNALMTTTLAEKGEFQGAAEAAKTYDSIIKELENSGMNLSTQQREVIAGLVRTKTEGIEPLAASVKSGSKEMLEFKNIAASAAAKPLTREQRIANFSGKADVDPEDAKRVKALTDAINAAPGNTDRKYRFTTEITGEQTTEILKNAGTAALDSAFQQGEAEMDRQYQANVDGIKSAGDQALKGIDQQQKASEKAFAAQEKALSNKHKAQTKNLDNQIKAETKALDNKQKAETKAFDAQQKAAKKAFDKQQKEARKMFDKKQKEDKKIFDKQQREDRKQFDEQIKQENKKFTEEWDQKEKALEGVYSGMEKSVDKQAEKEAQLDKDRDRYAENEKKRLEMLADLNNNNIDINVALAGGDLDEAARLMNASNQTANDYYSDIADSDASAASEKRQRGFDQRKEQISGLRDASMEAFGKTRERAQEAHDKDVENRTEAFGDKQSDEADAFGEKQSEEADVFGERQSDEADAFGERQAAERETFQEKLAREKEEFEILIEQRREQLQRQQEMEMEFLNNKKAAEAEYFAQQRENIQAGIDQQIKGAEQTYNARKAAMKNELELLKTEIPKNEKEVGDAVKRMEGIYGKYGINLQGISSDLNNEVMKSYHHSVDMAAAQLASDKKWEQVGKDIGKMMSDGVLDGMDSNEIIDALMSGKIPNRIGANERTQQTRQGNKPPKPKGRATGGPIFGPGTATSDSIMTMLSNGEHVWTAAEVEAMGGHAEMQRLRDQVMRGNLPKFAAGGAVGGGGGSTKKPDSGATSQEGVSENGDGGVAVTISPTGGGEQAEGGILAALNVDVQALGQSFDANLTQTAAPTWQMFGDQLLQIKTDTMDPVFTGMNMAMQNTAAQMTQATTLQMTPAWNGFGAALQNMQTTLFNPIMDGMRTNITGLADHTGNTITQRIMPSWQQAASHIQNMQNQVIDPTLNQTRQATNVTADNFGRAADQIGVGWGRVKENTASPVRFTIGTVYNEGLVGMWNKLADKLDLKKFDPHPLNFATGGVLPGFTPGRDVHHFSSPTGGRLHLSGGEAIMRPEWTRAVGGPAAVNRLNAAARSGNLNTAQTGRFANGGVYGEDSNTFYGNNYDKLLADPHLTGHPAEQSHASGGIFLAPWADNHAFSGGPIPRSLYVVAKQVWPGFTNFSGFRPGDAQHGQNRALDIAHGSPTSTPQMRQLAATIADYYKEDTIQLIHHPFNRNIMQASNANVLGPSNFVGNGMAAYSPGTMAGHQNHVHWAAKRPVKPLDGKPIPPDPGGDGGDMAMGPMIDPAILAAYNEFTDEKNKLKERVEKFIKAAPDAVPSVIPGKVFAQVTKAMETKIQEAMPGIDGSLSMGDYGGNAETYVKEIIAAAKERGLPAGAARIAIATALVESELRMLANPAVPESFKFPHDGVGYDHDSIGLFQQRQAGWGTTAQRMNARASAGMFFNRLTQFNWGAMDPGAAAQKVQVSAFPDKYATRMGHADALMARVGGFENANNADKPKAAPVADKAAPNKGAPSSWFDSGGLAQGKGYMPKDTVEPERVLSPQQTKAFDKMVDANFDATRNTGSLGSMQGRFTTSHPISQAEYMAKLTNFNQSQMYTPYIEKEKNKTMEKMFDKFFDMGLNVVQSLFQQVAIPGIIKLAEDGLTIQSDADLARIVGKEVADALVKDQLVSFQKNDKNESNMVVNGNVYGDAHLQQLMEKYRVLIMREMEARLLAERRRLEGK